MSWQPRKNLIRRWKGAVEPGTVESDIFVTNYAEKSEDLASFRWSKIRITVDAPTDSVVHNGVTIPLSPFIEDDTPGLSHYLHNTIGNTNAVGHPMVISCYVKPAARTWIRIGQNTVPSAYTYFNLSGSGVIGSSLAGVDAAYIEEVDSGVYRCEVVFTPTGVVSDHTIQVAVADNDNTFDGVLGQTALLVGGYQLEQGMRAGPSVKTEDVQYTGFPVTERFLTLGTPPAKQTVTNSCGYSHTMEDWFQQLNITVEDHKDSINGIPLARITDDATAGYHHVGQVNQYTADATRRRLSIHVKAGTGRYVYFTDRAPSITNVQWSNIFDTQDGVWTFGGTLYIGMEEAVDLGSGVWRISWVSAVASGAYDNIYIGMCNGPTKEDQSYSGVGDTMFVGGAQIEYDSDAPMGPLVRHASAGTSGGETTATFGYAVNNSYKGAVEPTEFPRLFGLENLELDLPVGLENQVFDIRLVGSTILKIDEFNSSQVIVDREFAVKTELWNSNTTIKVPD